MLRELVIATAIAGLGWSGHGSTQKNTVNVDHRKSAQVADKRLDHIKLEVRTVGSDYPYEEKSRYGAKDGVYIRVMADNSGADPIVLPYVGSFVHYLPQLTRAGKVQAYSHEMQKRMSPSQTPVRVDGWFVKLPPHLLTVVATLNLSDWYGALEPGVYELKLKYRLSKDGPEIESAAILFEVTP